jgi:hypothetical protein
MIWRHGGERESGESANLLTQNSISPCSSGGTEKLGGNSMFHVKHSEIYGSAGEREKRNLLG